MTVNFSNKTVIADPVGVQSIYTLTRNEGLEGSISGLTPYSSFSTENWTGAVIPFGHALFYKRDSTAALPAGAAYTKLVGISIDSRVFETSYGTRTVIPTTVTSDGRTGYPTDQFLNVLTKGVIFVYTADDVNPGDTVRIYHTDSASVSSNGAYKGRFGKNKENGKTFHVVTGARWVTKTSAGSFAALELDLPDAFLSPDDSDSPPPATYYLTTESGDPLITEAGDFLNF